MPPSRGWSNLELGQMGHSSFSIRSTSSERELFFFDPPTEDGFSVAYRSHDLQASCGIYQFKQYRGIAVLLSRLASFKQPWSGVEQWSSPEGEFSLSAKCSPSSIVTFIFVIARPPGISEEWRLVASLTSERAQLRDLAKRADLFFRISP